MSELQLNGRLVGISAVLALCTWSPQHIAADDSAQVLDRVVTAHRAARESIRTLQTRFTIESVHPKQAVLGTGTYLRSTEGVLIRVGKDGKSTNDTLVKSGETRMVGRSWSSGNKITFNATRMSGTQVLGLSDIWQRLLLSFYGPNQQSLPFERYVETASSSVQASTKRDGGREIVVVTMSVGMGKEQRDLRFEFDAGANYLIRKSTLTAAGIDERSESEVMQFLEAQPGVFVPLQCRARVYKGGSIENEWLYTISEPIVNVPVPADRLVLPAIPSGTTLTDRVHGTKYAIDTNWNRIGPESPAPILKVGQPSSDPVEFTTQSSAEPRSISSLILIASILVLLAAGLVWGARRWSRRSATD